jgi:hypothetical protein
MNAGDHARGFAVNICELNDWQQLPSVDEFTQMVLAQAADSFRRKRELPQHFLMYITIPEPGLLIAEPKTDDPNIADYSASGWIHRGVRAIAKAHGARALFTVSEVWLSRNEDYSGSKGSQPRLDPERREAVLVLVENPSTRPPVATWRAMIERNKGRPRLAEWKMEPYTKITGRYVYLLPPEAYGTAGDA